MGSYNFLVEGVSGTGKTAVCHELRRRGFHALNGDTDLAFQGDPLTGEPIVGPPSHEHHIWPEHSVRAVAADDREPVTFFCGGSRNFHRFLDVFDAVFVLDVDADTLRQRLARRPVGEFGALPAERDFILHLHQLGTDVPQTAEHVNAARPLAEVVDDILRRAGPICPVAVETGLGRADAQRNRIWDGA